MTTWRSDTRHWSTAPFRGEGMDTLQSLADVVYDPWIEQVPLRLYNGEQLAARHREPRAPTCSSSSPTR